MPIFFKKCWLVVALLAGIALVLFISIAYSVDTVPTWNLPITPATLWAAAIASGPFVGLLGLCASRVEVSLVFIRICLAVALFAGIVGVVLLGWEYVELADIATTVNSARGLVPWFPATVVAFFACDVVATLCAAFAWRASRGVTFRKGIDGRAPAVRQPAGQEGGRCKLLALNVFSVAVSLLGCFVVRFAFYAMHMTSGV